MTLYSPSDPNVLITKRIRALGGDTVRLWVPRTVENVPPDSGDGTGEHLQSLAYTNLYQQALRSIASRVDDQATGAWLTITVPQNYVWVEGDVSALRWRGRLRTEAKSRDSREFGPVPVGLITARVVCILWPISRFGIPGPRPSEHLML